MFGMMFATFVGTLVFLILGGFLISSTIGFDKAVGKAIGIAAFAPVLAAFLLGLAHSDRLFRETYKIDSEQDQE